MEEGETALPPFWLQSSSTNLQQPHYNRRRRLSRASSFLLNSSVFLIVLIIIVLCFILVVVPKFLQFTSLLLRPQSVKRSWDYLNLVLVIFAIVCGFLGRNTNDEKASFEDRNVSTKSALKSNPSTPHRWYEYSDDRTTHNTVNRLRSSSSYPDLRLQEPSWGVDDERWRFYDDTHVTSQRLPSSDQLLRRREARPEFELENSGAKSNGVDRSEIHVGGESSQPVAPTPPHSPPPPPRSPSPPPTPPPPAKTPKVVKRKAKKTREFQVVEVLEIDEQRKNAVSEVADFQRLKRPPLSPPSFYQESEQKSSKNEKKRGGATKEFLTSLRRKKKKQRQKSIESFESIISSQRPATSSLPQSSPPPPPPLPPPSVFHNLFPSKKGKSKKGQSSTPPPQSSPPSIALPEYKPETEVQIELSRPHELPMEVERLSSFNDEEFLTRIGGESPLHSIPPPPPPPPPPFKMSDWKFVKHGDYISIRSNSSSPRAGSPELDESETNGPPASSEANVLANGVGVVKETVNSMFCPSPDVDSKADNFIARFRADLKLQKMNSMKEKKARKRSNLGRESSPGPN